jgi:hypothetical protein
MQNKSTKATSYQRNSKKLVLWWNNLERSENLKSVVWEKKEIILLIVTATPGLRGISELSKNQMLRRKIVSPTTISLMTQPR